MKKIVLLFLMFVMTNICVFGQSTENAKKDTSQTPVLDKTEQLVDKYSAKIADAFISSIDKATPFVKSTFTSVVYLQVGKGVAYLMPTFFCLLFLIIFINEYNKLDAILKSDKVPTNLDSRTGPFCEDNINPKIIISMCFCIICGIIAIFTIADGIEHLFAPQWFAVKDIIQLFKGSVSQ